MTKKQITSAFYAELQYVYDYFNMRLYDGQLDECLITLQRQSKCMGYMSFERFNSVKDGSKKAHELALNPDAFGVTPIIELFQTIVHEQNHCWQQYYGKQLSKRSYHNQEFADKLESIGLMTSDTGQPHGKRTGEKMADYPIPDGLFLKVCEEIINDGRVIEWYDAFSPEEVSTVHLLKVQANVQKLIPSADPRLHQIPHLNQKLGLTLSLDKPKITAAVLQDSQDVSEAEISLTQASINEDETVQSFNLTPTDHFDIAIAQADISPEAIAALQDGFTPKSFEEDLSVKSRHTISDLPNPELDPAVVKLYNDDVLDKNQSKLLGSETINNVVYEVYGHASEEVEPTPKKKPQTRAKFQCPECKSNAWCKPSFVLRCDVCDIVLALAE